MPHPLERLLALILPHLTTFFSFSAIQVAQLVLPLLALPWLARVLGPDTFGLLMYMSVLPPLVELATEWGFRAGGTREAARLRGDKEALGKLLGAVISGKLILALACMVAALLLLPFIPHAAEYPLGYRLAILMGVSRGMTPVWFFQGAGFGMQRMALWDVGSSLCALALTFIFIRQPEEWPLYLFFNALCKSLVYGTLSYKLMCDWNGRLSFKGGWLALASTRTLFASAMAGTLSVYGSQMVLGFFLSASDMGLLVSMSKIIRALISLANPAIQTLFPELCAIHSQRSPKAARLLLLFLAGTTGCLLLASALVWITAPWIINLALGPHYIAAVPVLRLMLLFVPLAGCNMVLGAQVLVPLGLERQQNLVLWCVALLCLPLAALVSALGGLEGGALLPSLAEALTLLGLALCIWRNCPGALIPGARLP